MSKYIKEIKLTNDNSFNCTTLYFKSGVNIIIGPKGGGKSTLMKLLNNFNTVSEHDNDLKKTLTNNLNLKALEIVYSDDEKITNEQLSGKENEIIYKNFISQDDDLKTRLDQTEITKKEKEKFINEIYDNYSAIFQKDFNDYLQSMKKIYNIYAKMNIEYSRLSNLKKNDNKLIKLISKFNFNLQIIEVLDNLILENEKQIKYLKKLIISIYSKNSIINESSIDNNFIFTDEDLEIYQHKIANLNEEIKSYNKSIYLFNQFNESLEKQRLLSANSEDDIQKSTRFKEQIKIFIQEMSHEINNNKNIFEKISKSKDKVNIKKEVIGNFGLKYSINANINIYDQINTDDDKLGYVEILSSVIYKPSKNTRLYNNWIDKMIDKNGFKKSISNDKIFEHLKKSIIQVIEKFVITTYEDKEYSSLSLGQRTSLMLENKLKKIDKSTILFLDQPEDNIDNYTIANSLVNIINTKESNGNLNQIFIITHNANFGVLLNPKTLTICEISKNSELDSIDNWYKQYFNLEDIDKNIDKFKNQQSNFLEGGNEILKRRYKKLLGE